MKIKESFLNIKEKIGNIKKFITSIFKTIIKDKVDVSVFLIAVILSILDFVTTWDLTGAIALLTIYISGLLFRLAVWKLKQKQ